MSSSLPYENKLERWFRYIKKKYWPVSHCLEEEHHHPLIIMSSQHEYFLKILI